MSGRIVKANLPHDVYWLYDAEDRVLYIGCSHQLTTRLEAHARQKEWWNRVSRVEVERYTDRATARTAEATAIRRERPIFNKHVPITRPPLPPIIRRDEPLHAVEVAS